jgi:hypothetical protein
MVGGQARGRRRFLLVSSRCRTARPAAASPGLRPGSGWGLADCRLSAGGRPDPLPDLRRWRPDGPIWAADGGGGGEPVAAGIRGGGGLRNQRSGSGGYGFQGQGPGNTVDLSAGPADVTVSMRPLAVLARAASQSPDPHPLSNVSVRQVSITR